MDQRPRRVLGIDPGLTRCGLGVVAGPPGRPELVAASCLRTDRHAELPQRLLELHDGIVAAIEDHRPDVVAIERVLFSRNVQSAMATGQAAGIAQLCGARAGLEVAMYSPNEVKSVVAGHGGADKDAVARMVAGQLRLATAPRPVDVTDALAVALTHLGSERLAGRLSAAAEPDRATGDGSDWAAAITGRGLRVVGGTPAGTGRTREARR